MQLSYRNISALQVRISPPLFISVNENMRQLLNNLTRTETKKTCLTVSIAHALIVITDITEALLCS